MCYGRYVCGLTNRCCEYLLNYIGSDVEGQLVRASKPFGRQIYFEITIEVPSAAK